MEYKEEDYLMISGLQHFQFCRRQWALIHIEQQWDENVRTLEGQYLHRKVDQPQLKEKRADKLIVRAMPVHSPYYGITGVCDVVEFIEDSNGIALSGRKGLYRVYPVEYKRGKPKTSIADELQLTAQVICLEEMLCCEIDSGALYYHEIKRRVEVKITLQLKEQVRAMILEMQEYFKKRYTPKAKIGNHCNSCSLQSLCLPQLSNKQTVKRYIEGKLLE